MITIKLVRIGDRLVGQTVSDRWNLMQLGLASIPYDRKQGPLNKLRRAFKEFTFKSDRGQLIKERSQAETLAFTRPTVKPIAIAS
jgi:hypothetical protein